jgi:hypothetical protein
MNESNSIPTKAADETVHLPFGPPPVVAGEDERAYQELSAQLHKAVQPLDIIEQIFLRDFIDLQWTVLRLRGFLAHLSTWAIRRHLALQLKSLFVIVSDQLINGWVSREPRAVAEIDRLLKNRGIDINLAIAACLSPFIERIDRIDQLATRAEARRNAHLREIERHRAGFGASLRKAVALIEAPTVQPA